MLALTITPNQPVLFSQDGKPIGHLLVQSRKFSRGRVRIEFHGLDGIRIDRNPLPPEVEPPSTPRAQR